MKQLPPITISELRDELNKTLIRFKMLEKKGKPLGNCFKHLYLLRSEIKLRKGLN